MKKIAILGSTGSIGTQTLDVVRANKDIEVLGTVLHASEVDSVRAATDAGREGELIFRFD